MQLGSLSGALRRDRRGRRPRRCGDRALALLGGDPSLRVAVVAGHPGGSEFGETLTPNALPLLEQLGVGGAFLDDGPLPSHGTRLAGGQARYPSTTRRSSTHWARDGGLTADGLMPCSCGRPSPEGRPLRRCDVADRLEDGSGAMDGLVFSSGTAFLVDATGRRATTARAPGYVSRPTCRAGRSLHVAPGHGRVDARGSL